MAEAVVLEGRKRRALVAPGFIALVLVLALVRGGFGARTSTGRIVLFSTMGPLLVVVLGFVVYLLRKPADRLEVRPDRIVLWQGADRGVQLGTTPPIVVRRRIVRAGTNATTTWELRDGAGVAHRFAGSTSTALDPVMAVEQL